MANGMVSPYSYDVIAYERSQSLRFTSA